MPKSLKPVIDELFFPQISPGLIPQGQMLSDLPKNPGIVVHFLAENSRRDSKTAFGTFCQAVLQQTRHGMRRVSFCAKNVQLSTFWQLNEVTKLRMACVFLT